MGDLVDVDEWCRWLASRRGRRTLERWAAEHPVLGQRPPFGDVRAGGLGEVRWSPLVDRRQAALVALTQRGDGRAAITLLVQLRPGLGRLVRLEQRRWGIGRAEAVDEVRSAFFETVCVHPLHHRPDRIAANLVLDTRQRLRRSACGSRRPPPTRRPFAGEATGRPPPPGSAALPSIDLLDAVGRVVRALPGSAHSRAVTATAAYRAWVLDQSHGAIADDLGLDRAAVRQRLHRLRSAVRHQWHDHDEAA